MRERRDVADTRVWHLSSCSPPPRHSECSPRRGRHGGKYSREDERRRIERRNGFDGELDLQDGSFYYTVDRERYGATPKRLSSPWRSDKDRNPLAGRFFDSVYRNSSGIGPRHSRSPQRVGKTHGLDADPNPRHARYSDNVDRDWHVIGARHSRSPQKIEKRDSFGVNPNPRAGSFLDAVDKDRNGVHFRHSRSPWRNDGRDGFDGDSDLQVARFRDAVGRDRYGAGSWHSRGPHRFCERDVFEGDLSLRDGRFSDNLDRDRFVVGTRRSRSPSRIKKGFDFDMDINAQVARFSSFDNGERRKYGVEISRRLYEEDLLRGDLNSEMFEFDHISDAPRKSDVPNVKYSSYKNDHGVGGNNSTTSRGGGEWEDYLKNQYVNNSEIRTTSVSHHLATIPVFLAYNKEIMFYSDPETLDHESVGGVTKSYLGAGDGCRHLSSVASRHLSMDTDKQGHFNVKNGCQLDKRDSEFLDQGEHCFGAIDKSLNIMDGLPGIERPLDHIPITSGILNECFPGHSIAGVIPLLSHGMQDGTVLVSDRNGFDGSNERPRHMSPRKLRCRFDDSKSKSRLFEGLPEQKRKDYLCPEFGGITEPRDFQEEYHVQHMSRLGLLDSVDETSLLNHIEDDRPGNKHPSSLGQSISDNFGAYESLHPRNQDLDMLGSRSLHLNFEREKYHGCGNIRVGEYNDDVHHGSRSLTERSDIFPSKDDPLLSTVYRSQRNGLDLDDKRLLEPTHRRPVGKYPVGNIQYDHHTGIRISSDGTGACMIYNDLDAGDYVDPARFLERPESRKCKLERSKRDAREIASNRFSSSRFITNRSSILHTSGSRDIKNRLGPVGRRLHVSQRLTNKKKPSLKKLLAPAPSKKHNTRPWLKHRSSKKVASMQDDSNGNNHDQGGEQLGAYFPLVVEPPEQSEDFKQLVHSAFFKFLKQINETPEKRKEYVEPEKDGNLKCIVCCSDSNEFVDTEKMAMHAFKSKKVGLRSQHLGFYKALCVLMGWKIAVEPSSDWHCEVMSNAEISGLKEDLIIWPPVMIIHNLSIDNKMANEHLEVKLRDMGIGSILNVSTGKPANKSVMIVKFHGTLSGLQEAERLHLHYVENKHGRSHLKQLKLLSKNGSSIGDTQVVPAGEEAFLYGYLGNAEDLDKLDSDIKKRCVIKSKKEILSIVEASVDTNVENDIL